jgi:hypothetical protein
MKSVLHTGPALRVKIAYTDGTEKLIGYATGLSWTADQGQKAIFTVDTPIPAQIAQGAAPSFVRGSMQLYLPKGMTLESAGLVSYRTDNQSQQYMTSSKYFHIRIYDRQTEALVLSLDWCKVGRSSVSINAKAQVRAEISFEGFYASPGNPG